MSLVVGVSRVGQGQLEVSVQFFDLEEWTAPGNITNILALDLEASSQLFMLR